MHSVFYEYCSEICKALILLLENVKENVNIEIKTYLNNIFKQIFDSVSAKTGMIFKDQLNRQKMCFNDIQYSYVACNLMFLTNMVEFITNTEYHNSFVKFKEDTFINNLPFLNCFIHKYLNKPE